MQIDLFEGMNAAIIRAALCTQHAACLVGSGDNKATAESCLGRGKAAWRQVQGKGGKSGIQAANRRWLYHQARLAGVICRPWS
ncbi:hypothetical protein VFPPC_17585 [Pochonia chlamydosporia 170]|uniref:Uncharacterized protein n=1 Tax=Pochonia chlamydosporia 170 TaxID=1380566 RepID=A0A219ARL7_METCM|nr:hypothetical protein VFPPC_17585 [Pochonia chlamydosporia 170]OWT43252.1 hypothetical protein VFPPC_17585 [Pochonia chlamydosporia 170]